VIATKTLDGTIVRLAPLSPAHAGIDARWMADAEVRHWLHRSEDGPETRTRGALERKIGEVLADPTELRFVIETRDGVPIGDLGLLGIHPHGRAELSIKIGERSHWSGGYGTDAIRRLLGFAFAELGLRRVTLIADADNARGIRCYEKCGFRHEGLLRAHRLRYGKPLDMVTMGILREEFRSSAGDAGGG
jgi:RimJ/RimL family protein N-acetyltransferase